MNLYTYLSKKSTESKAEMARQVGISESSLYKYVNKQRTPELHIAIRIVKFTKGAVDFEDLLVDKTKGMLPKNVELKPRKKKVKVKIKDKDIDTDLL